MSERRRMTPEWEEWIDAIEDFLRDFCESGVDNQGSRLLGRVVRLRAQAPEQQAEECPDCLLCGKHSPKLAEHQQPQAADDYAAMLRQVAHHLRSDKDWRSRITGLLQKHGGMGSPLRQPEPQQPAAAPELADHAFLTCCCEREIGVHCWYGCGRPRSEHPEGR